MWGTTGLVFSSRYVQAHLLDIKAGGYCSEHRHERKSNVFTVISGRLEVRVWEGMTNECDSTILGPGQSTAVPVGLFHQFVALEPTVCLEFYEAAEVEEDIKRRSQGGAPS